VPDTFQGKPAVAVALDYGRRRIGIAVSTALGTVHPRPRLDRTTLAADLEALVKLLAEAEATVIVIGLPHHMDGAESEMEREARAFGAALAGAAKLPVYGVDERLTTEAADSALRASRTHWRQRKERRDSAAACLLLADYLEARERAERIA
jgi:putative Holliday junction resolvase